MTWENKLQGSSSFENKIQGNASYSDKTKNVTPLYRLTEDGEDRVLETGRLRLLENGFERLVDKVVGSIGLFVNKIIGTNNWENKTL